MSTERYPFDLERALRGDNLVTRDGQPIVRFERSALNGPSEEHWRAFLGNDTKLLIFDDGRYNPDDNESNNDLFMAHPDVKAEEKPVANEPIKDPAKEIKVGDVVWCVGKNYTFKMKVGSVEHGQLRGRFASWYNGAGGKIICKEWDNSGTLPFTEGPLYHQDPRQKPEAAVEEDTWHNPENAPSSEIPSGFRFLRKDEADTMTDTHSYPNIRVWLASRFSDGLVPGTGERKDSFYHEYTYICPLNWDALDAKKEPVDEYADLKKAHAEGKQIEFLFEGPPDRWQVSNKPKWDRPANRYRVKKEEPAPEQPPVKTTPIPPQNFRLLRDDERNDKPHPEAMLWCVLTDKWLPRRGKNCPYVDAWAYAIKIESNIWHANPGYQPVGDEVNLELELIDGHKFIDAAGNRTWAGEVSQWFIPIKSYRIIPPVEEKTEPEKTMPQNKHPEEYTPRRGERYEARISPSCPWVNLECQTDPDYFARRRKVGWEFRPVAKSVAAPPTKSIRAWLEELPEPYRSKALKSMPPVRSSQAQPNMQCALYHGLYFAMPRKEWVGAWQGIYECYVNNQPLPQSPITQPEQENQTTMNNTNENTILPGARYYFSTTGKVKVINADTNSVTYKQCGLLPWNRAVLTIARSSWDSTHKNEIPGRLTAKAANPAAPVKFGYVAAAWKMFKLSQFLIGAFLTLKTTAPWIVAAVMAAVAYVKSL